MTPSVVGAASISGDPKRNIAFVSFKSGEGSQLAEAVASDQRELLAIKGQIKALSVKVNEAKTVIDDLNSQIHMKRGEGNGGGGGEVIDAEEYELLSQLKAAKLSYRRAFDQLKDAKEALEVAVAAVGDSRSSLMQAFNDWYDSGAAEDLIDGADLDPDEEFALQQQEGWKASDPEAAAYLSAKKVTRTLRPVSYGGDKGRAQNIRRREALQ